MRTSLVVVVVGLIALLGALPGTSAVKSSTPWGDAIEVPGMATLNAGGNARVQTVACGAVGDCAAGGYYEDGSSGQRAFVVSEKKGVWGSAVEVPGLAALNGNGGDEVTTVSCAAAGECAAGGYYKDGTGHQQAFVLSEKKGVWHKAIEVPGLAALNVGGAASVTTVSCGAARDCAAGGYYNSGSGHLQAFVVTEKKGVWGSAVEVPGSATLNTGGNAEVISISCAAARECAAGGLFFDGSNHSHAFVLNEKKGVWGSAVEVPGTAALNVTGVASVTAVSCGAVGSCAAGGYYRDGSNKGQAFVVSETKGVWGKAVEAPGTATLNAGGGAGIAGISCAAAGECAAAGYYKDGSGKYQAFLASERKGVWGAAVEAPGTQTLNAGGDDGLSPISCGAVGECASGGYYDDNASGVQALVTSETKGVWSPAVEVPGTAALNVGDYAQVKSVSCAAAGECAAGGGFVDGSGHGQAFVADLAVPCVVPQVVGKTLGAARNALSAAHCGVGKIERVHAQAKKGRVVAQSPKPSTHLHGGGEVALTVSTGKK